MAKGKLSSILLGAELEQLNKIGVQILPVENTLFKSLKELDEANQQQAPAVSITLTDSSWSGEKDDKGNTLLTYTDENKNSYTIKKMTNKEFEVEVSPKFSGQICFGKGKDIVILKYDKGKLADTAGDFDKFQFTQKQKEACKEVHVAEAFIQMEEKFIKDLTGNRPKSLLDKINDKLQTALLSKDSFEARELRNAIKELKLTPAPLGRKACDKLEVPYGGKNDACTLTRNKDGSIKVEVKSEPKPAFSGRIFITGKSGGVSVLEYKNGELVNYTSRGRSGLDPAQQEEFKKKIEERALKEKGLDLANKASKTDPDQRLRASKPATLFEQVVRGQSGRRRLVDNTDLPPIEMESLLGSHSPSVTPTVSGGAKQEPRR